MQSSGWKKTAAAPSRQLTRKTKCRNAWGEESRQKQEGHPPATASYSCSYSYTAGTLTPPAVQRWCPAGYSRPLAWWGYLIDIGKQSESPPSQYCRVFRTLCTTTVASSLHTFSERNPAVWGNIGILSSKQLSCNAYRWFTITPTSCWDSDLFTRLILWDSWNSKEKKKNIHTKVLKRSEPTTNYQLPFKLCGLRFSRHLFANNDTTAQ